MSDVIRIDGAAAEDRFARLRLIGWWDQERLARARVVVIGAGALGNEIVKDLALLGRQERIRRRSRPDRKLEPVAIDPVPGARLRAAQGRCGRRTSGRDLSRDPRPAVCTAISSTTSARGSTAGPTSSWGGSTIAKPASRSTWRRPERARSGSTGPSNAWMASLASSTPPPAPAMNAPWARTTGRCSRPDAVAPSSTRDEMELGKVPTTPTTASIIAGIQVQEAIKYLHGLETIAGQGFVFDGTHHQSYLVSYTRKADCPAHDADLPVESLPWQVQHDPRRRSARAGSLRSRARSRGRDRARPAGFLALSKMRRRRAGLRLAGQGHRGARPLSRVPGSRGRRPLFHTIDGRRAGVLDLTLGEIGVPPWDVLGGRSGMDQRFYELSGDRDLVLGRAGRRRQISDAPPQSRASRRTIPDRYDPMTDAPPQPDDSIDVRLLARQDLPHEAFPARPERRASESISHPKSMLRSGSTPRKTPRSKSAGCWSGAGIATKPARSSKVIESIRGEGAETRFAEVTFTHQTWAKINAEMDTKYTNLSIVGWYHTHPDFGIFLSDRDRFIHEHFFSGPGQVAHVIDPIRRIEGIFVWRDAKPTLSSAFLGG